MLKKDSFQWSPEAVTAFESLKQALTSTPVLAIPDFSKEFVIECDASDWGIGAVLSQEGHPVAYMIKALAQRHLALSVYDKEMLAAVSAVQHWRPYLLGHHFKIYTDHKTIEHFLGQRITTPAQQKWLLKLMGYDYSILYKAGKNNAAPDALSREGMLATLGVSTPVHTYVEEIQKACKADPTTSEIIQLQSDLNSCKHYTMLNSQLLYKGKVFVPNSGGWRQRVMAEFHDGLSGGHAGSSRTYERLKKNFAWSGIQKDVKRFVAACEVCQRNHYETRLPPGLLQPLAIPDKAWSVLSMDFIEGLPKSDGNSVIWVVIDKLTKFAHFIPLKHPFTVATLAQVFVQEVFRLHGMPEAIISDRDPIFLSLFWEAFFNLQGTKLRKSSAYHPQTDGQTENLNRTLEQYLRCVAGDKPHTWVQALPWAEWWYNTAHHASLKMTPFKALYGYDPPMVTPYISGSTSVAEVDAQLKERDEMLATIKRNLLQAQSRMKGYYDKKHTEREFQVGDWVYLKLQPYRQQSVNGNAFHKLAAKYYGPFQIIARIGTVAYKLQLPDSAKIHNVFHVSLLKKKVGTSVLVEPHLPNVKDISIVRWTPEKVLQTRMVKRKGEAATQWLIHWLGTSPDEATWEFAHEILQRYPNFQF
ncbi:putative nucleotidyltransferase, Ribonuclease H [Rosa chinensis]|uniref:Putative nucleotidyltransferase, Ribonuclease H n=1 Tax=Rosa chinensis TaxID=74649 RepID=A0A2P6RBT8_ROSCH|nr:putative nucleotidyltransferase, Ribonuclease H [Rosa chinensis]